MLLYSVYTVHTYLMYILFLEESRAFLREAMKQGFVYVTLVKVILEGPAGRGQNQPHVPPPQ